jgi:hypothetical protein
MFSCSLSLLLIHVPHHFSFNFMFSAFQNQSHRTGASFLALSRGQPQFTFSSGLSPSPPGPSEASICTGVPAGSRVALLKSPQASVTF